MSVCRSILFVILCSTLACWVGCSPGSTKLEGTTATLEGRLIHDDTTAAPAGIVQTTLNRSTAPIGKLCLVTNSRFRQENLPANYKISVWIQNQKYQTFVTYDDIILKEGNNIIEFRVPVKKDEDLPQPCAILEDCKPQPWPGCTDCVRRQE